MVLLITKKHSVEKYYKKRLQFLWKYPSNQILLFHITLWWYVIVHSEFSKHEDKAQKKIFNFDVPLLWSSLLVHGPLGINLLSTIINLNQVEMGFKVGPNCKKWSFWPFLFSNWCNILASVESYGIMWNTNLTFFISCIIIKILK